MTKLSTIKALLEEPFTGKLNVDKNETAQDVKDHTRTSAKYDNMDMEQKITLFRKQHSLGRTAVSALSQASEDRRTVHVTKILQKYEHLTNLSVAITRQLEREREELKQMISKASAEPEAAPEQTDTPPAAQKVE